MPARIAPYRCQIRQAKPSSTPLAARTATLASTFTRKPQASTNVSFSCRVSSPAGRHTTEWDHPHPNDFDMNDLARAYWDHACSYYSFPIRPAPSSSDRSNQRPMAPFRQPVTVILPSRGFWADGAGRACAVP